jgi:hypothetical protein
LPISASLPPGVRLTAVTVHASRVFPISVLNLQFDFSSPHFSVILVLIYYFATFAGFSQKSAFIRAIRGPAFLLLNTRPAQCNKTPMLA